MSFLYDYSRRSEREVFADLTGDDDRGRAGALFRAGDGELFFRKQVVPIGESDAVEIREARV
jgi:hypothetical protein